MKCNFDTAPHYTTLDLRAVLTLVSLSKSTLEKWMKAGLFPRPDMRLGRKRFWFLATIRQWLAEHLRNA